MTIDLSEAHGINPNSSSDGIDLFSHQAQNSPPQNIDANKTPTTLQKIAQSNWNPGVSGLINDLSNSAPVNFTLGAGDAIHNLISNAANIIPGVNFPLNKTGEGAAYTLGNVAGNVAGFMGGGELLNAGRLAAKGAPLIGDLASALEGSVMRDALRRIGGSAVFGAVETPEDRLKGALVGGALGAAGEALPGAISVFTKPREVAQGIQEFIASQKSKVKDLYQDVLGKAGQDEIQGIKTGTGNPYQAYGTNYEGLNKDIFNFNKDVKKIHDDFLDNPTIENAHKLQSQLGYQIGKFSNKNLSISDYQKIDDLRNAREALRGDIITHLENSAPNMADNYKMATDIFRDQVAPLKKFNESSPKDMARVLGRIDKKGELSPELQQHLGDLNSALYSRNLGLMGAAAGLGALGVGSHMISPVEAIAALVGGKFLGAKSPEAVNSLAQNIFTALKAGGSGIGNIAKANIPGGNQ